MRNDSVKNIVKNTSIIASAQVVQIFFGVLRTKAVALLLGPFGVGIVGLYQSTIQLLTSLFGLGISQSIVKSVAEYAKQETTKQKIVINTSLVLVAILGFLAVITTIIFSTKISRWTFGDENYAVGISILSITILLNLFYAQFVGIIQGLRKLKKIALISVFSSILGFSIVIPLYYFLGIDGILPALLIISISNILISIFFVKSDLSFVIPSLSEIKNNSLDLMRLGIALAFSGFFLTGSNYLIRIAISDVIGIEGVGFLNVATTITTVYLNLVFTAMGTDFYPKLAQINRNNSAMNEAVHEQILIGLLVAGPIVVSFVAFAQHIIIILYSSKFLGAILLLKWQLFGTLIKAFSWPIGFILLAKGYSKTFVLTELTWNLAYLFGSIVLLNEFSIAAVGISYLFSYTIYATILLIVTWRATNFKISKDIFQLLILFVFGCIVLIFTEHIKLDILKWLINLIIVSFLTSYSFFRLNKMINIKLELKKLYHRITKR